MNDFEKSSGVEVEKQQRVALVLESKILNFDPEEKEEIELSVETLLEVLNQAPEGTTFQVVGDLHKASVERRVEEDEILKKKKFIFELF